MSAWRRLQQMLDSQVVQVQAMWVQVLALQLSLQPMPLRQRLIQPHGPLLQGQQILYDAMIELRHQTGREATHLVRMNE